MKNSFDQLRHDARVGVMLSKSATEEVDAARLRAKEDSRNYFAAMTAERLGKDALGQGISIDELRKKMEESDERAGQLAVYGGAVKMGAGMDYYRNQEGYENIAIADARDAGITVKYGGRTYPGNKGSDSNLGNEVAV